jgi:hypothetical protein
MPIRPLFRQQPVPRRVQRQGLNRGSLQAVLANANGRQVPASELLLPGLQGVRSIEPPALQNFNKVKQ